jgi:hypothetical protein
LTAQIEKIIAHSALIALWAMILRQDIDAANYTLYQWDDASEYLHGGSLQRSIQAAQSQLVRTCICDHAPRALPDLFEWENEGQTVAD